MLLSYYLEGVDGVIGDVCVYVQDVDADVM
jgi:hypothetical protein